MSTLSTYFSYIDTMIEKIHTHHPASDN